MDESIPYQIYPNGSQPFYDMFGMPVNPAMNRQQQHPEIPTHQRYSHDFSPLDPHLQYNHNTFVPQTSPPNRSNNTSVSKGLDSSDSGQPAYLAETHDALPEEFPEVRSSSEEKDGLNPTTSRRKEQNRAAQRAFRERKERHVKELEKKLAELQANYSSSQSDNERLKQELAKVATERDILRATTSSSHPLNAFSDPTQQTEEPTHTGPMYFVPTDSYKLKSSSKSESKTPAKISAPHATSVSPVTGERLLSAAETWDIIQSHPLFTEGLLDIGHVCERLKSLSRCNGHGPSFEEADVLKAIEESTIGRKDELI